MGKKKAITNEALERRCWEDLAIAIILQALDDYTALDDDRVPLKSIIEIDGDKNLRQYFHSDRAGVTEDSAKRFRQNDAFLFLNSSWFELLNPTKYTGNELIDAKLLHKKDAFLFLNSSWFELLNPTKYTGNELIRMTRRFKSKRNRNRFMYSLAQVMNGGTSNDHN